MSEKTKLLVAKGREKGFLTAREVNEALPADILCAEQINDIHTMLKDIDIDVLDE